MRPWASARATSPSRKGPPRRCSPSQCSPNCSRNSSGLWPTLSGQDSPNRSGSILLRTMQADLGVSQTFAGRSSSQGDGRPLLGEPRMIEQALIDYYRCPEECVTMSLAGELSLDSGYFRFGHDICYAQSSCGPRGQGPAHWLYDTLPPLT